jgi:hypothetical protein
MREASFALERDVRILRGNHEAQNENGCGFLNITTSFNTEDLICTGCKDRWPHSIAELGDGQLVVLVYSQESMDRCLESGGRDD